MALLPELERTRRALEDMVPRLAEARRRYAQSYSERDRLEHDRVQGEAQQKLAAFQEALERVQSATGLPPEFFEELDAPNLKGDRTDRRRRAKLAADEVEPTGCLDDNLGAALEAVVRRLPPGWLEDESADLFRLPTIEVDRPFSIVKGFRPESERTGGHRLRQMVQVGRDRLAQDPRYDHFGGALLVPQLVQLGTRFELLDGIPGATERIENLWKKPSEVENTIFELLVAAGLAELGRKPSFIDEVQAKTPDIRVEDPFPLVVECKRRSALSEYELREETIMRTLFCHLEAECRRAGFLGVFDLTLFVEAADLDVHEVVAKCVEQRLAARPRHYTRYVWGSVAFRQLPARLPLPGATKAYSPELLEYAFGWNNDVPKHDGLICRAATAEGVIVNEVRGAIALAWANLSDIVLEKRSRPPTSLFGKATKQMPGGEFGIVYICYPEGAREEIADRRVQQIAERLREWEHSASFRIPLVFLSRLYPRALASGAPDIIESTMSFLSEVSGGDPWMLEAFPSCVFTRI